MKVGELVRPGIEVVNPYDSVRTAAQIMADRDQGILPVGEDDRLVGMITERDIAVRAIARGCDPEGTPVREIMSSETRYCFADEEVAAVSRKMDEWRVSRLAVVDRDERFVGIVSLGEVAGATAPPAGAELWRLLEL